MGINRAEQKPASPDVSTGTPIVGHMSRIFAAVSFGAAAVSTLALMAYSSATYNDRQDKRIATLSELVAPDLAWRETDRIQHIFDVELGGNALALDESAQIVTGKESLIDGARHPVVYQGEPVGFIIAPAAQPLFFSVPAWLILASGVLCIAASAAFVRRSSARLSASIEQLTDYAGAIGDGSQTPAIPDTAFAETDALRLAMEAALGAVRSENRKLRSAAFSDPVTGLPNRNRLREAMASKLGTMSNEAPGAFVMLDLDGFVRASDSFGKGGDQKILLTAIERIASVLNDFEARGTRMVLASLQSDNFGLFIPECTGGRDYVSEILQRLNRAFEAPLAIGSRLVTLGISGGVTMLPEDGKAPGEIFRRADMALQEARKTSRNAFEFYAPSFDRIQRGRFRLEAELRSAAKNSEFIPVFQPKIDFSTGRIMGAEALARWYRDGGKVVMPGTFIGVAEEIGLIDEIGRQILVASCDAAAKWYKLGFPVPVAVNVSPRQFEQNDFAGSVIEALRNSGLPPHLLELEITESMAIDDPHKVAEVMRPLREMGVRLAIDDFGTGHSNLVMLTQLPFDVFKIDRQFVSALQSDRQAPAIVEMILAMAESLGLKAVAEGIETEAQAEFLRKRGCALGQGFLYSPGVSLDKFIAMLKTWQVQGETFQTHQYR